MNPIVKVLMRRDGMDKEEAEALFEEAKKEFDEMLEDGNLADAEEICYEWFGLEPDYLDYMM